jgi:hypothetical protein
LEGEEDGILGSIEIDLVSRKAMYALSAIADINFFAARMHLPCPLTGNYRGQTFWVHIYNPLPHRRMPYETKHFKPVMQNPNVPGQNLIVYNPADDAIYKREKDFHLFLLYWTWYHIGRYLALKEMVYELEDVSSPLD